MKKTIGVILILVSVIFSFGSVSAENEQSWEDVFFVKEDSWDMDRLLFAIGYSADGAADGYLSVKREIAKILEENHAYIDLSKVYVAYSLSQNVSISEDGKIGWYLHGPDKLPGVWERYLNIPVYKNENNELMGFFFVWDATPDDYRRVESTVTPNNIAGGPNWMEICGEYPEIKIYSHYLINYKRQLEYAEEGYEMLKNKGRQVKTIRQTANIHDAVLFNTDQGYYVYPVVIKGEESKGKQMVPLDEEFVYNFNNKNLLSLDTKPTPTPTPTVSRTPFQPMTTTPTVTPRPSGTGIAPRPTASAGSGTETAAVSPTASPTVPGPKKTALTWLIPVIVLCCAAAGGIAWAAIAAGKKKKDK